MSTQSILDRPSFKQRKSEAKKETKNQILRGTVVCVKLNPSRPMAEQISINEEAWGTIGDPKHREVRRIICKVMSYMPFNDEYHLRPVASINGNRLYTSDLYVSGTDAHIRIRKLGQIFA